MQHYIKVCTLYDGTKENTFLIFGARKFTFIVISDVKLPKCIICKQREIEGRCRDCKIFLCYR